MIPRRERVRQMTLDEIKAISWETLAQKGIENLTINGIARQMGMTPPAFYRYYKNRDELIKTLVLEAYASFRTRLETARDEMSPSLPGQRLYRVYSAYREWAIANPNMFGLFAGRKVYGFDPRDPQVTEEADKVYLIFIDLYQAAWENKHSPPGADTQSPPSYMAGLKKQNPRFKGIPLEIIDMGISGACLIHGMISMEISGRLGGLVGDTTEFYDCQIKALIQRQGIDSSPI